MSREGAIVSAANKMTRNLPKLTRKADILIVAAGVARLIGKDHVKAGQIVIDVGINVSGKKFEEEIGRKKIVGDVDFEEVKNIVRAITPVPGGAGPMTVASLFVNLVEAYRKQVEGK